MPSPLQGRSRVPVGWIAVVNGVEYLPYQFLPAGTTDWRGYQRVPVPEGQRVLGGSEYITITHVFPVKTPKVVRDTTARDLVDQFLRRGTASPKLRDRNRMGRGWGPDEIPAPEEPPVPF